MPSPSGLTEASTMPLSSMTGFARHDGNLGPYSWTWEVKSVNGKSLDVRCRMPPGFDALEPEVRRRVNECFRRGNFQVGLTLKRAVAAADLALNEPILRRVLDLMQALRKEEAFAPPTLDGVLALKGILEITEPEESDEERAAREAAMLAGFGAALGALEATRRAEGARLASLVESALTRLEALRHAAETSAAAQPEAQRARLRAAVAELLGAGAALSEDRLAQEVALLLVKGDVREELDRLAAHIEAARELIDSDEPVGRRLDFLMQELNREANTLCSKAADVELTRIGLDLKAVIDQVREQVQNVE